VKSTRYRVLGEDGKVLEEIVKLGRYAAGDKIHVGVQLFRVLKRTDTKELCTVVVTPVAKPSQKPSDL
jgi:hypothetical protein